MLEEETFERFGYYPNDLKSKSKKKIIAQCDDCGKIRAITKQGYRPFCPHCVKKKEHISIETRERISKNHADFRGEKGGNWKGGLITIECGVCGKEKKVRPDQIKKGWGKYCSSSCNRKARRFPRHRTKLELFFEEICKKHNLPYKYTGDGSFWIGKKPSINPDFVNCNGKKIAIEIFGDYWHSPLLNRNIRYSQTFDGRNKILKEYGWKLVVFWGVDLLRVDAEQFILNKLGEV